MSKIVEEMQEKKEILDYPISADKYEHIYACMDTNDFWVSRILKEYDKEYERDENKYLIERNKISIYDVMDKLYEIHGKRLPEFKENELPYEQKNKVHFYFRRFRIEDIIKAVILLDDEDGLTNWDNCEAGPLEKAIKIIDGGFGILNMAVC